MSGSKPFGPAKDYPKMSPSAGKPILQFDPSMSANFTDLLDTLANYTGKGGYLLIVNVTEDGVTAVDPASLVSLADKNYVHTQAVANVLWTVNHNLGKYPSVRIKDALGQAITGDIVDVSINQLTIEFSTAQTGVAIIN